MFALVVLCGWSCVATSLREHVQANPIRKVVTLLQDMQNEINGEGEKEKALYDKFMCYCDGNTAGMSASAKEAGERIVALNSQLDAQKAEHSQLTQELQQHGADREGATRDLEEATAVREKEHAACTDSVGEQKTTIGQLAGAISALEKGMGSKALVQMSESSLSTLKTVVTNSANLADEERTQVLAFLESKQNPFGDYSSQSGEIVGILKAMKDEMDKDLNGAISDEEAAQAGFEQIAAAKKAEISAASGAIETKTKRAGDLAVAVVTTEDDIEDTTADMNETNKFLANLAAQCASKKQEWEERSKSRAAEVAAIGEAIKVLNDDDALDLFKKTLSLAETRTSMGFLQRKASVSAARIAADRVLKGATSEHTSELSLIAYALKAKKVDFSKVLGMIDSMVTQLGEEQKNDDAQKQFCDKDLASSEAAKKDTEDAIAGSEATIAEASDASANTAAEIKALQGEVAALDKAVADASAQRKEEHGEFVSSQTEHNAALQLVEKAKNKLFKVYRPDLHKEAPKRELTDEEKILAASGRSDMIATEAPQMIAGTTQTVYAQVRQHSGATPAPPPETWGAYSQKDGKSNGVIALMDMLVKELQDDMTAAENEENTAQKDYERLMASSTERRAKCVDSITNKEAAKADLDVKVENTKEQKTSQNAELMNTNAYIAQLHANCDFLVANYDLRKAARANEVESLKNAKSVLSGANYA